METFASILIVILGIFAGWGNYTREHKSYFLLKNIKLSGWALVLSIAGLTAYVAFSSNHIANQNSDLKDQLATAVTTLSSTSEQLIATERQLQVAHDRLDLSTSSLNRSTNDSTRFTQDQRINSLIRDSDDGEISLANPTQREQQWLNENGYQRDSSNPNNPWVKLPEGMNIGVQREPD